MYSGARQVPYPSNPVLQVNKPSVPFSTANTEKNNKMRLTRYNVHEPSNAQTNAPQQASVTRTITPSSQQGLATLPENQAVNPSSGTDLQPLEIEEHFCFNEKDPRKGTPRLTRGMSKVSGNEPLVLKVRDINIKSIAEDGKFEDYDISNLKNTSAYTFPLPNIYGPLYHEDQRAFLHHDLIETSTLVSLEQSGHLNWWAEIGVCRRLMPRVTSGDGNCLLHAASLAMWGYHDRQLGLRQALSEAMDSGSFSFREGFKRRWRWSVTLANRQIGLVYSEEEWDREWSEIVSLASPKPRDSAIGFNVDTKSNDCPLLYESLEELHVFVLANVLRRPIIIIAKTMLYGAEGEAMCPIPFSGIYLPLERDPSECHRTPLLLTYDSSHFSALVPVAFCAVDASHCSHIPADAIPLVNSDLELLTIHYLIDPDRNDFDVDEVLARAPTEVDKITVLREYLDVLDVPIPDPVPPQTVDNSTFYANGFMPESEAGLAEGGAARFKLGHQRSDSEGSGFKSDSSSRSDNGTQGKPKSGKKDKKQTAEEQKFLDPNVKPKSSNPITKSIGNIRQNISKAVKGSNVRAEGRQRRLSGGVITQSTRIGSQIIDTRRHVTCASLVKRVEPDYWSKMVENYLASAMARFTEQQAGRRRQHEEIRRLSIERSKSGTLRPVSLQVDSNPADLNNVNNRSKTLDVRGMADNEPGRYAKTVTRGIGNGVQIIAGTAGAQWVGETIQGEGGDVTMMAGKSKFYMTSAEDHCLSPNTENRLFQERLEQAKSGKQPRMQNGQRISVLPNSKTFPEPTSRAVFDSKIRNVPLKAAGTLPASVNSLHADYGQKSYGNNRISYTGPPNSANNRQYPASNNGKVYGPPNNHTPISQTKSVPIQNGNQRVATASRTDATNSEVMRNSPNNFFTTPTEAITQQLWLNKVAAPNANMRGGGAPSGGNVKCRTDGCNFNATPQQNYLCSNCYRNSNPSGVATLQTAATRM